MFPRLCKPKWSLPSLTSLKNSKAQSWKSALVTISGNCSVQCLLRISILEKQVEGLLLSSFLFCFSFVCSLFILLFWPSDMSFHDFSPQKLFTSKAIEHKIYQIFRCHRLDTSLKSQYSYKVNFTFCTIPCLFSYRLSPFYVSFRFDVFYGIFF